VREPDPITTARPVRLVSGLGEHGLRRVASDHLDSATAREPDGVLPGTAPQVENPTFAGQCPIKNLPDPVPLAPAESSVGEIAVIGRCRAVKRVLDQS
jgi:hypothetical protein